MTRFTPTGIAYDDRGTGELSLLFLPGWCGPRTLFEPLLERLEGVRALALDWRSHGESKLAQADFGSAELVDDALAVIHDASAGTVVPVSMAHAGWIAIELRRRLGPKRIPRLVFLDWMVLGAPPPFIDALSAMASPATTRRVVDEVTAMWLAGVEVPALSAYVATMAASPDELWARAAREIAGAFGRCGTPLEAVAALDPPPPTLHLYAQPSDAAFLEGQRKFAQDHPWFDVERLDASSHFPMFEVPDDVVSRLLSWVRGSNGRE